MVGLRAMVLGRLGRKLPHQRACALSCPNTRCSDVVYAATNGRGQVAGTDLAGGPDPIGPARSGVTSLVTNFVEFFECELRRTPLWRSSQNLPSTRLGELTPEVLPRRL